MHKEKLELRSVRIYPSTEAKIKAHYGTLSQGLRRLAEHLDTLNTTLKNLQK